MENTYDITREAGDLPASDLTGITVNEALLRWPHAIAAINSFGIDTCCGGSAALGDAAAEAGIPLEMLLAAITSTAPVAGPSSAAR